ncbi:Plus3 domain-containing protein [Abeliophyllum distichum]|uniref:Plus3 domain-containing protein n=1 Tax=Abeliophyllum distichum TaxID=126358 RepID=A0ABD1SDU9_9LAMI
MSSSIGGDATRFGGGEASPPVSSSMEGVLPIRGVDGSMGEAIPISSTQRLREAEDLYRADVVRWAATDVPSIMVEEDLTKLREAYRIPVDIELILPDPKERACFPRRGCTTLNLNAFLSGMRLPLHPMLRRILRAYDLAPTQVAPNGWSQMVGGHVPMVLTLLRHGDASSRVSNHISAEEVVEEEGQGEEVGWYYFCPWGSHKPLVTGCPSSIKQWKESWFWVSGNWQRVFDDPEPDLDVPSVPPSSLRTVPRYYRRSEIDIPGEPEEPELRIDPE